MDDRLADFYEDLPSGWGSQAFADLLLVPLRNGIYKSAEFHGDGVRIVNMGELFAYPRLRGVEMKRLRVTSSELEKAGLSVGDLMFARRSLVAEGAGKCSLVMDVPEPTVFESSIIRARPDPAKASSGFLYYLFSSQIGRHLLGSILRQTAVSGITGSDLSLLPIPLPPLPEQRAIAEVLGALDDKIELNRQMNHTLEEMASALFKSWFVDFDPVIAKAAGRKPFGMDAATAALFPTTFADSDIGSIPRGWQATTVGAVAALNPETWKPGNTPERLRYLDLANVKWGVTEVPVDLSFAEAPSRARRVLRSGDTIFGTVRPANGSFAFIATDVPNLTGSTGFAVLRPRSTHHQHAVYLTVTQASVIEHFAAIADGSASAYPAVPTDVILSTPFMAASPAVMAAFEKGCRPWFDLREANEAESRTLTTLRDTLLPKLLSGEIRLKQAEKAVEAVL